MFFDIEKIYIGKICSICDFDIVNNADVFSAFVKIDDKYVLINRGRINKLTKSFSYKTIFQTLDDINMDFNIAYFYVDNIKPITKIIPTSEIKKIINLFDINKYLFKYNMKNELKKTKIKN